ncbi:break repair meiotic recombinase recruitment factor 1 isoform X2 [Eptesicus fuscus]|uniref:break repair meiotic recombinase recruitment factor 1 isoform X2 n=1 Tax=Eptesicus fuscus TaxID=29078 RepID=UPI0024048134|nr:break repair meiotic recombinase recruitment factor 1 isoform X2 [Eptesicus fuscus]
MSKRKKLRTSGEGIRPPKPPKHPRLRDSDGDPQSFQFGPLSHPEESKGRSGPVPSTEQSGEESGQEASSSLDKEPGAPSRLLSQPEKEPIPFPPSQNSDRRFVPQFAKPRKTVTRLAAAREEDLGSGAFSSETPPEPSAQRAGSQAWQESPELTVLEAWEPGDQTQADGTHSEHSVQNSVTPVSSRGDSQPEVSNDISSEWGMVPLVSESASQDCLLEQGTNLPDAGSTEGGRIPGDLSQKGHLPSSGAEKEPDRGVPQEEGVQGGTGTDQEKGDSVLGLVTQGSEPGSAAQAPPDPLQILSRVGREAGGSHSSPRHSSLRISVITDVVTDPAKSEQRALELSGPDEKANTQAPASPSEKAPDGGHSGALLTGPPLSGETAGSREAGWEAEAPGDVSRGPAASLVLAHETQEPSIGAGYSSPVASEMGPVVGQTQVPDLDQEGLGGVCTLSLLSQPSGEKAAELGSQSHEQDLGGFSLSLGASVPPLHRETVGGPPRDARAHQGSPDAPASPAGQPKHPDPADQAALELDFLPDSQIQDALEALNFEAPPEQLFPAASGVGPCWPSTSLSTEGGPLIESQPSTHKGIKPCEATRMEDATDTMRGLIIELSNLNRLIMNAHRDLEAFKRLNYRKAKPAGKAPMPYTSKRAGALTPGEQPWRDL